MKKHLLLLLFCCWAAILGAQTTPGASQQQPIVIINATIHIGNGQVIENGFIHFDKGKIVATGTQTTYQSVAGAKTIDAKGKHVYPGFISANTTLGLTEVDAVRPTRDFNEVGDLNPNVRSIIAYNTDSKIIPTLRFNGILLAQTTPQGGRIPGMSSVVQLDAWNWEDAAYKTDDAIHLNWPEMYRRTGWWAEPGPVEQNKEYDGNIEKIRDYFKEAQAYAQQNKPATTNLKFEAMKGLFDKSRKLMVHVDGSREILHALNFTKEFGVDLVIVGGADSWRVTEQLKQFNVPVLLGNVHALPGAPEDDIDQSYKLPYLLQKEGILIGLTIYGSWEQRNLPFHAGTAAAYGLTKEQALSAITLNTAKILGIDKQTGSLEPGKDANLFISLGDALDMRTNQLEAAFIQGREVDLSDHQQELYDKFKTKYSGK
jgi:imidazolonepropionase-like amidohydrolase